MNQALLNLMPEVIATLRAEGMSVNLVNKLEVALAAPAVSHPSEREALKELVDLHDIKLRMAKLAAEPDYLDSLDKMATYDLLSSDYSNRRPKAWQAARAALSTPPMEGDALDAKRYRGWRDAAVSNSRAFAIAVKEALPPEAREGKPRWPTADEWSAAIDAAIAAMGNGDEQ